MPTLQLADGVVLPLIELQRNQFEVGEDGLAIRESRPPRALGGAPDVSGGNERQILALPVPIWPVLSSKTHARFGDFQTDSLRKIPELHVNGVQLQTCGTLANPNLAGAFP